MNFLKKSAFLLVFIAVITAALCLYGCKKSSASDEENGIIMVSKDVFEEKISVVGGKLSPFSVEELKQYDIPYIADGESYYLLLHLTDADMYGFSIFVNGATLFNENEMYALGTGYKNGEIELRSVKSDHYDYVSRDEAYEEYPDELYGKLYVDINEERKGSDYYVAARIDGGKVITEEIKIEVEIFLRKQQGDKVVLTVNKQPSHAKHVGAEATVKYLTSSDYMAGSIDTKLKDTLVMSTGERYYAVIDYVLSSPVAVEKNDTGNIRIDVYDPAAVGSGGVLGESYNFTFGVEEFPTAIFTKDGTGIDSSFTLPSEAGESRRYRFIVSLSPVGAGSINLRARLYSDEITFVPDFKLEGSLSTGEGEEIERTFDYELSGDGSYYTVVGVGGEVGDSITVPSTHNGKPVKAISDDAFSTFKHLKEVKLTAGIEKIGKNAFSGCTGLKFIVIPSTVTSISQNAFSDCQLSIFFEGTAMPSGWVNGFNPKGLPVYYDCFKAAGPLSYTLNSDGMSYTVSGGDCAGAAVIIPSVYGGYPVTHVATGLSNFTEITLPESISNVSGNALNKTTALTYASVPAKFASVIKTDKLQTLVINSGDKLASNSFKGAKVLNEVTLSDSITEIGDSAFSGCTSLNRVNFGSGMKKIGASAFMNCGFTEINLQNNVTHVGASAFKECNKLQCVIIGNNVTSIGSGAFSTCIVLKSITIGTGVSELPSTVFYGARSLSEINIPSNVTTVGSSAFKDCTSLVKIKFEGRTPTINSNAFYGCESLVEVLTTSGTALNVGSTSQGYVAYYALRVAGESVMVNKNGFLFLTVGGVNYLVKYVGSGGSVTLPTDYNGQSYTVYKHSFYDNDTVTGINATGKIDSIGKFAFYDADELVSVSISSSVKEIEESAFDSCGKLKTFSGTEGLQSIKESAFNYCALESIGSLSSLTELGGNAFYGCNYLSGAIDISKVTSLGSKAFYGCTKITEIKLGDAISDIPSDAFIGCNTLSAITVSADNGTYKTVDGVLYSKDGKTLVRYAPGKTATHFTVPDGVEVIGKEAFYSVYRLKSVTLSDTVTTVSVLAFNQCLRLRAVELGEGVTSIGANAFGSESLFVIINRSGLTFTKGSGEHGRLALYAKSILTEGTLVGSDDFVFVTYDSENHLISYAGNDTALALPESCNGGTYVIDEYAFYGNTDLISVTIPANVTGIGEYAFGGCDNLQNAAFANLYVWFVYDYNEIPTYGESVHVHDTAVAAIKLRTSEKIGEVNGYAAYVWKYNAS